MNIFVINENHEECARQHVDRHVTKMPLETAQLLCTSLNLLNVKTPYKSCHVNHPCRIWTGKSRSNFIWLCQLGIELCKEYTFRYERVHASQKVIEECMAQANNIPEGELTPFAQAMPDEYKNDNPVSAYRNYYIHAKKHLAAWKKRNIPEWYAFV